MSLTFIAGDGAEFPLDDSIGIRHMVGSTGLDAAPAELSLEPWLDRDGETRVNERRPARTILLPLFFHDEATRKSFTTAVVRTATGDMGQLRDETSGRILLDVVYVGGLEGNDSRDARMVDQWRKAVIELRALDPYWYGDEVTLQLPVSLNTTMNAALRLDEPIPMNGGDWVTLSIVGDAAPDGYVTLTGPFEFYVFGDLSGTWSLAEPLGGGELLVVDSRVQSFGPRRDATLDVPANEAVNWSLLDAASIVHPIASDLRVVIGARSTGSPSATFTYRSRWLTP